MSGTVERPGVYEVAHGDSLEFLLAQVGARNPRGLLLGGYFGRWLSADQILGFRPERSPLAAVGAFLGCGVVAVIDDRTCAVSDITRVAAWFSANSARHCGTCTWGPARPVSRRLFPRGRYGHARVLRLRSAVARRWSGKFPGRPERSPSQPLQPEFACEFAGVFTTSRKDGKVK